MTIALTIQTVADQIGVSAHTLRYYERIGLVDHIQRRPDGHRTYTAGDIEWLVLLTRLRESGMPIRRMQQFAALVREGEHTVPDRLALLREHQIALEEQHAVLQRAMDVVSRKVGAYQEIVDHLSVQTAAR